MKKILITGGCGAIGSAFISAFYDRYRFYSYARNQEKQLTLKKKFPKVELYDGSIEDYPSLMDAFTTIKPDIVIHAAAFKHIHLSEKCPSETIKTNLLGSLNVINISRSTNVPLTIGLSSDKACYTNSVYGSTKNLMERLFLEADTEKNKFVCCRLCNVAGSDGSVIPLWLSLAEAGQPLQLTNPKMNRFMFSSMDAAHLINRAIEIAFQENTHGFIMLSKVKAVNLFDLAESISPKISLVGKRQGEQLNETLVRQSELAFTYGDGNYIRIYKERNSNKKTTMTKKLDTKTTVKMNKNEIQDLIATVVVPEKLAI